MTQIFYALITIVTKTTQWLKAKATGKPYDSGMN